MRKIEEQIRAFCELRIIDGSVKDVVILTRDLIMSGMRLAADPLAGRRERANPCLSVLLKDSKQDEIPMYDILRLEQLLEIYYNNKDYIEHFSDSQYTDYAILDESLIISAFI